MGLHYNAQATIRHKTCFASAEMEIVARSVCDICDVDHKQFIGRLKTNPLSDARKIFFHLCRVKLYTITCRSLGEYAGKRDHSTIIHAVRRCEDFLEIDPEFRRLYVASLVAATQQLKYNGYSYKGDYKDIEHGPKHERTVALSGDFAREGAAKYATTGR